MIRAAASAIHATRRRMLTRLETQAIAISLCGASVYIFGWMLGIEAFQSVIPGFPTMRPRTSLGFVFLGISLFLSLRASWHGWRLGALASGATLAWLISLIVPLLMGSTPGGAALLQPILATFTSLTLAAAALLIVDLAPQRHVGSAGIIALAAATPALYRILSLLLFRGAPPDPGSLLNSMALHTALLIVWFMACVLMHPRLGLADVLLQPSLRGRIIRRALPVVIGLPVGAAAISLALSLAFGWRNEVLFGLTATLSVTIGALLLWWLSGLVADWQGEANERANRLNRANEALDQYASSAAHDLKAPARHIRLYGELLEAALAKGDIAQARSFAASMTSAAAELPVIIDGMLEFSRSGYSKIQLVACNLSELVHAAAAPHQTEIGAAGARIETLRPATLWCDAQLMTTVFQNLIANSLANRSADRPLVIRVDVNEGRGRTRIAVIDNGCGFDPEFAAVALNPLARGVKTAGGGAGIGLATCRTILASHGGDIRIDAGHTGGARIDLVLPGRPRKAR